VTPTARTLAELRRQGFLAAAVERWIPVANVRADLWGFADVLAVPPRDGIFLLVQATTTDHTASRLAKARGRAELAAWLRAGGAFEVWGWCKRNRRWEGKRVAHKIRGPGADHCVGAPARTHTEERQAMHCGAKGISMRRL
jgi:hypothetical protein